MADIQSTKRLKALSKKLFALLLLTFSAGCHLSSPRTTASALHWQELPPIPDPEGFAGSFAGTSGSALVVAGGANFISDKWDDNCQKTWTDSVFVLEQPNAAWQTGFKLPRPLGYGVSVTVPGGIICLGGSDSTRHYADVFKLSWTRGKLDSSPLPLLPNACAYFCGAVVDNTIYVAGGIESPDATVALKTFWALDLNAPNPRWQELSPWPGPERMLAVAGAYQGAFYLFSGVKLEADSQGKARRRYLRDAYCFRPGQGWKRLADMPRAAAAAPTPVGLAGGLVIFSGDDGSQVDFKPLNQHPGFSQQMLAYDVKSDSWAVAGEVPFSRATTTLVEWNGHLVIPMGEVRPRERTQQVWWTAPPANGGTNQPEGR